MPKFVSKPTVAEGILPSALLDLATVEYLQTLPKLIFSNDQLEVTEQGELLWNEDEGTLDLGLSGGVILHVGQDVYYRVKNQSGVQINKGDAVGFAGTVGESGLLLAKKFLADGSEPSKYFMGVAASNIIDGGDGYVVHFGKVRKLDTTAYSPGAILYADPANAGGLVATAPTAPNNIITVASVVHSDDQNGELFVRATLGSNLAEDELVNLTSPADGDSIVYNSSSGVFENQPPIILNATNDSSTTLLYPVMVESAGSNETPKVSTDKISFNAATGTFTAVAKSFTIQHPTKPDKKLRYGSLEGPENGVYVRGVMKGDNVIQLPEYWTALVDPDSITVHLTPIGANQDLWVEEIVDNTIVVGGGRNCFYIVYAERIDIDKLEVELG